MLLFYFFSPRVLRSVAYGPKPRQRCDIYIPRNRWLKQGPRPVVIFITGGAWIIGAFLRKKKSRDRSENPVDPRPLPQGTKAGVPSLAGG